MQGKFLTQAPKNQSVQHAEQGLQSNQSLFDSRSAAKCSTWQDDRLRKLLPISSPLEVM